MRQEALNFVQVVVNFIYYVINCEHIHYTAYFFSFWRLISHIGL